MELEQSLLLERSKAMAMRIVAYVGDDESLFDELLAIMLGNDARLAQLAAWPAADAARAHPQLLRRHWPRLMHALEQQETHNSVRRSILRMMEVQEIPEKYAAPVLDQCIEYITSESAPIAVRAYAITIAAGISARYTELTKELLMILAELSRVPQPPAITVRIRRALKMLLSK